MSTELSYPVGKYILYSKEIGGVNMADGFVIQDLCRFVGRTVTIFTTSGGLSGSGFTGVLVSADSCFVKLITNIGAAPDCPVGSDCSFPRGFGFGFGFGFGRFGTPCPVDGFLSRRGLGSVVIIPVDKIVSFVHTAI